MVGDDRCLSPALEDKALATVTSWCANSSKVHMRSDTCTREEEEEREVMAV